MQVVGVAACNVQLHLALKLTHLCSAICTLYFLIPLDVVVVAILYITIGPCTFYHIEAHLPVFSDNLSIC